MVRGIIYLMLVLALLLLYVTPSLADPPPGDLDQYQTDDSWGQLVTKKFWAAQTFQAGNFDNLKTRQLVSVELMLGGIGGSVTVQIREYNGGIISENPVPGGVATINLREFNGRSMMSKQDEAFFNINDINKWNGTDIMNMPGEVTINKQDCKNNGFDFFNIYKVSFPNVEIIAGNRYAIVVSCADNNICFMSGTLNQDYVNGDAYYSLNKGKDWFLLKQLCPIKINDFYFKTYVAYLESFSDEYLTTVCDDFDATEDYVYVGGDGLVAGAKYDIAYFDGGNNKVETHAGVQADSSGMIQDKYLLTSHNTAVPGAWHVVVYKEGDGTPAGSYNSNDPNIVLQDEFDVDQQAIPEFPAVFSSIMVVGMCAGIYSRIKKRKLSMAG